MADDANELSDATRKWASELIRNRGVSPSAFAKIARVSQSAISRLLNGETEMPSMQLLTKLAAVSDLAVPQIVRQRLDHAALGVQPAGVNGAHIGPDIPVWGVFPTNDAGEFRINPIAFQTIRRPPGLSGQRRLAVFYAQDERMAPRWRMGEPVLIDLARPATVGGFALVRLAPTDDPNREEVFVFRRYDGRRDGRLLLSELHDEEADCSVPISRLLETHRILDWSDLLTL